MSSMRTPDINSKVVKLQACVLLPSKGLVKILMFLPLFSRLSAFPPDAHKHLVPPGHHPWCWFVCFCCAVFVSSLFFYSCFCASNFVSDSTRSSFSELILLCFFLVAAFFSENNAQFYVLYAIFFCNFQRASQILCNLCNIVMF